MGAPAGLRMPQRDDAEAGLRGTWKGFVRAVIKELLGDSSDLVSTYNWAYNPH